MDDAWARAVWSHREELLRMARRRTGNAADAADVVDEAITRALATPGLHADRVGAWLNVVTRNLCADLERERARAPRREAYERRLAGRPPTPEDLVLASERAAEIRARLDRLPARQREAVLLRASGLDVGEVAARMGVTYKVAEGLLDRARAALRGLLRSAARVLRGPRPTWRFRPGGSSGGCRLAA